MLHQPDIWELASLTSFRCFLETENNLPMNFIFLTTHILYTDISKYICVCTYVYV